MPRIAGATLPTQKTREDDHTYQPILMAGIRPCPACPQKDGPLVMENLKLDGIDVLLVDPDNDSRQSLRNILYDIGFRNLRLGRRLTELRDALVVSMPDFLISETKLPDGDFCELIQAIRHHEIGTNPFLPVIALTGDPSSDMVKKVIAYGADSVLAKPYSEAQVLEHIGILIRERNRFVVTSDYVGPDRRKEAKRKSDFPMLEVPNSLKVKATGQKEEMDAVQRAIDEAIVDVNLRKLERHAVQIGFLVAKIVPDLEKGVVDEPVQQFLKRLRYVVEDSRRRMVGTKYDHVSELCQSLIKVTVNIRAAGGSPESKDVRLLNPLSQAIQAGFGTGTAAAAGDISIPVGTK